MLAEEAHKEIKLLTEILESIAECAEMNEFAVEAEAFYGPMRTN